MEHIVNSSYKQKIAAIQNEKERNYWINKLSDKINRSNFSYDYKKTNSKERNIDFVKFELNEEIFSKLLKISNNSDFRLHIVLVSALVLLINKYLNKNDIIIGTPVLKQDINHKFINKILPLRNQIRTDFSFKKLLIQIRETIVDATENQNYPIETLPQLLKLSPSENGFPLFDIAVLLENIHSKDYIKHINVNVIFSFLRTHVNLEGMIEYNSLLYKKSTIEKLISYYIKLLKEAAFNIDLKIDNIEILSEKERKKLLYIFNDTKTNYPKNKTIPELFEEQVDKHPENIAVIFEDQNITYRQLDEKANQLANYLVLDKNIQPDDKIGILIDRSTSLIVAILGILKAGGAYVPLEITFPEERIKNIINDAEIRVVISEKRFIKILNRLQCECNTFHTFLCIDTHNIYYEDEKHKNQEDLVTFEKYGTYRSPINIKSDNLAYIIYTSGITGRQKGTLINHYNVIRVIKNTNYIEITDQDKILQLSNYAFDGSIFDIFGALLNGAALVMIKREYLSEMDRLSDLIKNEGITVFFITTAYFNALVDYRIDTFDRVRKVLFGGEKISVEHSRKLLTHLGKDKIIHVYGPTETTVFATYYPIDNIDEKAGTIPIGKPIANTSIYILDNQLRPVPIGAPGEIFIGGDGIAGGYLNNPKLTEKKFINSPFIEGEVLYRTGDIARWLSDGNIEFLDRNDNQVEIRGFRIELGEIEDQLLKHDDIKETIVIPFENNDLDRCICAYIVSDRQVDQSDLKEYLLNYLPDYMVPAFFVQLTKLPLTPNGKIEKKALPVPRIQAGEDYVAPRNDLELKLAEIWAEILNIDKNIISINRDFFELGGHSLKATIMVSKINEELNIKLQCAEIYRSKTIKELSEYIKALENIYVPITPVKKREYYPQSHAQKRLFILDKFENIGLAYNTAPGYFKVGKNFDIKRYENALKALIERHEILRTSFELINNQPVQIVHDKIDFELKKISVDKDEINDEDIKELVKSFIRPYDLSKAPLFRIQYLKLPNNEYLLLCDMHHIITDGTSVGIIQNDLMRLYNGEELEPLRIQYKDFSCWQNDFIESGQIKTQEDYWLDLFSDGIPRVDLLTDYPRPPVFNYIGGVYSFNLKQETSLQLKKIGLKHGATLYMNLLAAFNVLLHKYLGQKDIVVGTVIAGRQHHYELQKVIGFFVNALVIRNYPDSNKTYVEFLNEVKRNSIKAFENQDVQFEELVKKLNIKRDPSRNPIFDVCISLHNFQEVVSDGTHTLYSGGEGESIFTPNFYPVLNVTLWDLDIDINEDGDEICFLVRYYSSIFKKETIERFCHHFVNIIKQVCAKPDIRIGDIELISDQEKKQILFDFNQTNTAYPEDKTIHELFEEQVEKTPGNTAIVFENSSLTYKELEERANQVANYLHREKAIESEEKVGIFMNKSLELIIAIMGIWKVGGVYVPLDVSLPEERIKTIINDVRIGIIISQKKYIKRLNRFQWECESFRTFLCMDTHNNYSEIEAKHIDLTHEKELWNYVGETATDEITGGGWLTGYTGKPFSKEEMHEYGDNILKKLTPILHKKMRVLEIGCASGISMFRIAPKVGFYYGIDFSRSIIEKNNKRIEEEGHKNIALSCLSAHEIDEIKENHFDLVIINSVIQDFHEHNYLRTVIEKSIKMIGESGYLFIGDVMDQELKEALVTEMVEFKKANQGKNYKTKTDWSDELFLSRSFFEDLIIEYPELCSVEFSDKIYTIENELTKFRYDVLFRIDKNQKSNHKNKNKNKYQHDASTLLKYGTERLNLEVPPNNLAYIIYTSGSTGKPKGVMVEHQQYVNAAYAWRDKYKLLEIQVNLLQMASISFDVFAGDIARTLINGGKLVLFPEHLRLNFEGLYSLIRNHKISLFEATPALIIPLMEYIYSNNLAIDNLKLLILGSDICNIEDFRTLLSRFGDQMRIINSYGVTEATIDSSYYEEALSAIPEIGSIPIGKPLPNMKFYILDENKKLHPIGISGELYIGGKGVSRGYFSNDDLTMERFIENPFIKGEHLYKTGDLARWMPDGNAEFLGRMDSQVKIRGFRIELGEIESNLRDHSDIENAIVIDQQVNSGEKCICAYFIANQELKTSELRDYLLRKLPDYMIPSFFVQIKQIPLTPNGKVDRKALPTPHIKATEEYIAPSNEVEDRLARLWSETLGIDKDKISTNADFFELGGHSLSAVILVSSIKKEFGLQLPLSEVFQNSTIQGIAKFLEQSKIGITNELLNKDIEEKETPYVLINKPSFNNVFCFPPIIGFGAMYNSLSSFIMDYSIYAFNYLEDEKDIISKYIEYILDIQSEGPYVLMGYSAGGNLAFELLKELERQGYFVSDLILLDSFRKYGSSVVKDESLEYLENYIDDLIQKQGLKTSVYKSKMQEKAKKFIIYYNSLNNTGIINANLHLISSNWGNLDLINYGWENFTNKEYRYYQGHGDHWNLLTPRFLENNAKIIQGILDNIFKKR